uniref:Mannosyltransferase n=1 Tax=Blastobotrys adeninivorans TaxID=409370 RepID=A0A060SY73_BLAAD
MTRTTSGASASSGFDDLFSRSRTWRGLFFVTIILRTFFSLSTSYIHPDEHFQGPEAMADRVFGWATEKPWEFTAEHPARSYFAVWLVYGLPMSFFRTVFGSGSSIEPIRVFYMLRIWFALATWVLCDQAIDRLCKYKQDRIRSLVFVSTSYVTWTFQSHTFSNSVETVVLLWCLVIIHEFKHARATTFERCCDAAELGALITFGIFNRVTFPAFLILPSLSLIQQLIRYPMTVVPMVAAAVATAMLAVYVDTSVYKGVSTSTDSYVIAPLNNLLYNMDVNNLSVHGLHSRFTHVLINLPQLIGPAIIFLASTKYVVSLPFMSALSGLVALSLVPHQELRFLVPIVPLLSLCLDTTILSRKRIKIVFGLWFVFNLIMGVLMGTLHQGGVVPAQAYIGKNLITSKAGTTVVWWKTYPPPIWLLGQPNGTVETLSVSDFKLDLAGLGSELEQHQFRTHSNGTIARPVTVVDLMGSDEAIAAQTLDQVSSHISTTTTRYIPRAYLVCPYSAFESHQFLSKRESNGRRKRTTSSGYRLTPIWNTNLHLSMESLDFSDWHTLKPGLGIWEIQPL